jgi:hypothetical protein
MGAPTLRRCIAYPRLTERRRDRRAPAKHHLKLHPSVALAPWLAEERRGDGARRQRAPASPTEHLLRKAGWENDRRSSWPADRVGLPLMLFQGEEGSAGVARPFFALAGKQATGTPLRVSRPVAIRMRALSWTRCARHLRSASCVLRQER